EGRRFRLSRRHHPDWTGRHKLGVAFADGSSFSVSANARMEVNEFVYDPHGHFNSSLMSLTKGTFTFIAGKVAHNGSMKVNTPIGTMGIRGTAPRVEILNDGSVKFSTLIEEKLARSIVLSMYTGVPRKLNARMSGTVSPFTSSGSDFETGTSCAW